MDTNDLLDELARSRLAGRGSGVDLLEQLDRIAERWLAGAVVAHGHPDRSGGVPEQPSDGGYRDSTADQLGGEAVPAGVGVQAGLAELEAPAGKDPADVIRRRLWELRASGQDWTRECCDKALRALDRLLAERDGPWPRLALHVEHLRDQIKVLDAEAAHLCAAKASSEEKLDEIRVACRQMHSSFARISAPYVLKEIERLLPPEDIGPVGSERRDDDVSHGDAPRPSGPLSQPLQATEAPQVVADGVGRDGAQPAVDEPLDLDPGKEAQWNVAAP